MRYPHRRRWKLIVASVMVVVLITQPAMAQTPAPTEPPGTQGTVVFVGDVGVSIRADSTIPRGCNPTEVVQLITSFLDAFNRGDQQQLPEFFSDVADTTQEDTFHWYSVGGPPDSFNPGFLANNRDELVVYLADRHTHGERMTLLQISYGTSQVGPGVPSDRGIGFVLDVQRSADDIPTHQAGVKGGIDCQEQTILRWAMGHRGIVPDGWFGLPEATPTR
jgi:hypothetical protein